MPLVAATSSDQPPRASVLITTRDRAGVLRRAIESVARQTVGVELIVVDDGSVDDTSAMVAREFPDAMLLRNEKSLGIIAARNEAVRRATTNILFTLDDDAEYSSDDVVETVLEDMDHPRVGVVAIPHTNHWGDRSETLRDVPGRRDTDFPVLFDYAGGVNAKRIDLFVELGGYGGVGRQGEERGFCLRLLEAGYVVRVASRAHAEHYPVEVHHDRSEILRSETRNRLLFQWQTCPLPLLGLYWPGSVASCCRMAWRQRRPGAAARGIWDAIRLPATGQARRRPVPVAVYHLMRQLLREGHLRWSQVEPRLPAPRFA